jgi:hypothetical protein
MPKRFSNPAEKAGFLQIILMKRLVLNRQRKRLLSFWYDCYGRKPESVNEPGGRSHVTGFQLMRSLKRRKTWLRADVV